MRQRSALLAIIVSSVLASALLLPACSKDKGTDASSCATLKQGADGTSRMTVVAKDLAFSKDCVQVEPGLLLITFDNQDKGTAHNLHVTGQGINATTELTAGVSTQDLEVVLSEPGSYTFACDPHGTMVGTITVVEATS